MDRGERRFINESKAKQRMKRFWLSRAEYRRDYKNGKWYKVNTLNDALDIFKNSKGKLYKWIIRAKEHHSYHKRRSDAWEKLFEKRLLHSEKAQAKKDIDNEVYESSIWFEDLCCNCDNFPGDLIYKPGYDAQHNYCPFKKRFESGELNGDTQWKLIGCKNFWD